MSGKKALALAGAGILAVLCAGCGTASGEYYKETAHTSLAESESRLSFSSGVSNYYALQSAVLSMIGAGQELSTLPVGNYEGSLEEDLSRITQEITTENPLGCFAVSSIVFDQTKMLTYEELSITIQYKRTPEEIAAVREAPSQQEFERRLTELLSGYGTEAYFSVSALEDGEEDLYDRVLRCFYGAADTAYGLKSVSLATYPKTGPKRIVEVKLEWTDSRETLLEQGQQAQERAREICTEFNGKSDFERLDFVQKYLGDHVRYDDKAMRVVTETGGRQSRTSTYTAYGALVEGVAAQSGLAHGAKLLLDELGVPSTLIAGQNGGISYVWLLVQSEGVWYHYDPTGDHGLMSTEECKQQGYTWNERVYDDLS